MKKVSESEYRRLVLKHGVAIEMPSVKAMEELCRAFVKHGASEGLRNSVTFGQFTGGSRHALILPPVDEILSEFGVVAEKVGRKGRVIRGDVVVAPKQRVGVVRETMTVKGKRRAWIVFRYGDKDYPSGYEQANDESKLVIVARADRDERDRTRSELLAGWRSAMDAYEAAISAAERLAAEPKGVADARLGKLYDAAYAEKTKLIDAIGYNDVRELDENEAFLALQRRAGAVLGRLRGARKR